MEKIYVNLIAAGNRMHMVQGNVFCMNFVKFFME